PALLQALHEGYLASGVPGWGTAYQYTSVCESDPDRIVTFLTSRANEQAQQAQQYAEVSEGGDGGGSWWGHLGPRRLEMRRLVSQDPLYSQQLAAQQILHQQHLQQRALHQARVATARHKGGIQKPAAPKMKSEGGVSSHEGANYHSRCSCHTCTYVYMCGDQMVQMEDPWNRKSTWRVVTTRPLRTRQLFTVPRDHQQQPGRTMSQLQHNQRKTHTLLKAPNFQRRKQGHVRSLKTTCKHQDEEEGFDDAVDDVSYTVYRPKKLDIGVPHPDPVVENTSMAAVDPPELWYNLKLQELEGEHDVVKSGKLSALQLEAISYACQAHETRLPDGSRAGFFIGDGAGVGKGRQLAGIMLENFLHGRRKHVWISVGNDLAFDARRDLDDLGCGRPPSDDEDSSEEEEEEEEEE
ncbi:unnamed protein product, partial [Scytosiphon promiscuus]